ncbi:DUF3419 family protein [bacterium]|nr:DUF3419 family protein [bacterium]
MSKQYFTGLNYSLANEDTGFERALVKKLKPVNVLTVCGSGGRALPLAVSSVKRLDLVDLSTDQLYLAQLRQRTIQDLEFDDFRKFWGFPPFYVSTNNDLRREFVEGLKEETLREWALQLLESTQGKSPLYDGKWESTFAKISGILRLIMGKDALRIFEFDSLEEQVAFVEEKRKSFTHKRWKVLLSVVGNASFFNALLYKGHFVKKNIPKTHFDFYRDAYRNLFFSSLARDNFFLQMSAHGKLLSESGSPIEAQKDVFEDVKRNLSNMTLSFEVKDLIKAGAETQHKYDFVSLSDVPSYFTSPLEQNFMQELSKGLNLGAHVVLRSYLHVPHGTDYSGFEEVTKAFAEEIQKEKTQMYFIQVFKKVADHA